MSRFFFIKWLAPNDVKRFSDTIFHQHCKRQYNNIYGAHCTLFNAVGAINFVAGSAIGFPLLHTDDDELSFRSDRIPMLP